MAWLTLKQAPPYMCYEFGRFTSNGVWISRENPQNWGALGPGIVSRAF